MKNFLKRKQGKSAEKTQSKAPTKITNETVAEHREQVLAGGRKFKYPFQYQKHKLVINTLLIGIAVIIALVVLCWQQLYVAQNTSKLMYRVTQLFPVAVASVDGEPARYSDYLMRYRSSLYYAQKENGLNTSSADGQRQAQYIQRRELNKAEYDAYVTKLAREKHLSVDDTEVDTFIKRDIDALGVSLNAYEKTVLNSNYDWSLDKYKSLVHADLLKRKVSFAIDEPAKQRAEAILQSVSGGADFATVAREQSDDEVTKQNGGDSGDIPVGSVDADGVVAAAMQLSPGQVSGLVQGVNAYYIVKLTSKTDTTVHYQVIKIELSLLNTQFEALQGQGKIKEFISVAKQ